MVSPGNWSYKTCVHSAQGSPDKDSLSPTPTPIALSLESQNQFFEDLAKGSLQEFTSSDGKTISLSCSPLYFLNSFNIYVASIGLQTQWYLQGSYALARSKDILAEFLTDTAKNSALFNRKPEDIDLLVVLDASQCTFEKLEKLVRNFFISIIEKANSKLNVSEKDYYIEMIEAIKNVNIDALNQQTINVSLGKIDITFSLNSVISPPICSLDSIIIPFDPSKINDTLTLQSKGSVYNYQDLIEVFNSQTLLLKEKNKNFNFSAIIKLLKIGLYGVSIQDTADTSLKLAIKNLKLDNCSDYAKTIIHFVEKEDISTFCFSLFIAVNYFHEDGDTLIEKTWGLLSDKLLLDDPLYLLFKEIFDKKVSFSQFFATLQKSLKPNSNQQTFQCYLGTSKKYLLNGFTLTIPKNLKTTSADSNINISSFIALFDEDLSLYTSEALKNFWVKETSKRHSILTIAKQRIDYKNLLIDFLSSNFTVEVYEKLVDICTNKDDKIKQILLSYLYPFLISDSPNKAIIFINLEALDILPLKVAKDLMSSQNPLKTWLEVLRDKDDAHSVMIANLLITKHFGELSEDFDWLKENVKESSSWIVKLSFSQIKEVLNATPTPHKLLLLLRNHNGYINLLKELVKESIQFLSSYAELASLATIKDSEEQEILLENFYKYAQKSDDFASILSKLAELKLIPSESASKVKKESLTFDWIIAVSKTANLNLAYSIVSNFIPSLQIEQLSSILQSLGFKGEYCVKLFLLFIENVSKKMTEKFALFSLLVTSNDWNSNDLKICALKFLEWGGTFASISVNCQSYYKTLLQNTPSSNKIELTKKVIARKILSQAELSEPFPSSPDKTTAAVKKTPITESTKKVKQKKSGPQALPPIASVNEQLSKLLKKGKTQSNAIYELLLKNNDRINEIIQDKSELLLILKSTFNNHSKIINILEEAKLNFYHEILISYYILTLSEKNIKTLTNKQKTFILSNIKNYIHTALEDDSICGFGILEDIVKIDNFYDIIHFLNLINYYIEIAPDYDTIQMILDNLEVIQEVLADYTAIITDAEKEIILNFYSFIIPNISGNNDLIVTKHLYLKLNDFKIDSYGTLILTLLEHALANFNIIHFEAYLFLSSLFLHIEKKLKLSIIGIDQEELSKLSTLLISDKNTPHYFEKQFFVFLIKKAFEIHPFVTFEANDPEALTLYVEQQKIYLELIENKTEDPTLNRYIKNFLMLLSNDFEKVLSPLKFTEDSFNIYQKFFDILHIIPEVGFTHTMISSTFLDYLEAADSKVLLKFIATLYSFIKNKNVKLLAIFSLFQELDRLIDICVKKENCSDGIIQILKICHLDRLDCIQTADYEKYYYSPYPFSPNSDQSIVVFILQLQYCLFKLTNADQQKKNEILIGAIKDIQKLKVPSGMLQSLLLLVMKIAAHYQSYELFLPVISTPYPTKSLQLNCHTPVDFIQINTYALVELVLENKLELLNCMHTILYLLNPCKDNYNTIQHSLLAINNADIELINFADIIDVNTNTKTISAFFITLIHTIHYFKQDALNRHIEVNLQLLDILEDFATRYAFCWLKFRLETGYQDTLPIDSVEIDQLKILYNSYFIQSNLPISVLERYIAPLQSVLGKIETPDANFWTESQNFLIANKEQSSFLPSTLKWVLSAYLMVHQDNFGLNNIKAIRTVLTNIACYRALDDDYLDQVFFENLLLYTSFDYVDFVEDKSVLDKFVQMACLTKDINTFEYYLTVFFNVFEKRLNTPKARIVLSPHQIRLLEKVKFSLTENPDEDETMKTITCYLILTFIDNAFLLWLHYKKISKTIPEDISSQLYQFIMKIITKFSAPLQLINRTPVLNNLLKSLSPNLSLTPSQSRKSKK